MDQVLSLTVHEIDVLTKNSSSLKLLDERISVVNGKSTLKGIELTVNQKEKAAFNTASMEFSSQLKENQDSQLTSSQRRQPWMS